VKEDLPQPLKGAIKNIFSIVEMLQEHFGKAFTPGDKLIGDTGEALAEFYST
jgi:hypothetical protein